MTTGQLGPAIGSTLKNGSQTLFCGCDKRSELRKAGFEHSVSLRIQVYFDHTHHITPIGMDCPSTAIKVPHIFMKIPLALLLMIVCPAVSFAEGELKAQEIEEILDLTNAKETIEALRVQNVDLLRHQIEDQKGPNAGTPFAARLEARVMEKYEKYSHEFLGWEQYKPLMISIYDSYYTADQISQLLNFFKSDAGRAMIRAQPEILLAVQKRVLANEGSRKAHIERMIKDSIDEVSAELKAEDRKANEAQWTEVRNDKGAVPARTGRGQYPVDWPIQTEFPDAPTVKVKAEPDLAYSGRAEYQGANQFLGEYRFVFPSGAAIDADARFAAVKDRYLSRPGCDLERDEKTTILGQQGHRYVFVGMGQEQYALDVRVIVFGLEEYIFVYQRGFGAETSPDSVAFFSRISKNAASPEVDSKAQESGSGETTKPKI